jgi:TolB-like protein/Tfp pilus assembly protein PilF
VAVLPFEPLPGAPRDEVFGVGLAGSLIDRLGRVDGLTVRSARALGTAAGGAPTDPRTAGRELRVEAVVVGSYRLSPEGASVSARLLDVRRGATIWEERVEAPATDWFRLEDDLSTRLARRLGPPARAAEGRRGPRPPAAPAYEAYLRGRYHWGRRTGDDLRRAVANFRLALAHDPGYAAAWAGLANGHNLQGHAEEGRWAAERALALDPGLPEAHAALANVLFFHDWDLAGAERSLRRAIALNPSYATAHHWYAFLLVATGRPEPALAEIRRARELDPLSPILNTDVAQILLYMRRYDASKRQLAATLRLDEGFAQARYVLAMLHRQQGATAEALAEYETAARLAGSAMPSRLWPALAGDDRRAAVALPELEASVEARQYPLGPYAIAALHLRLGHREEALAWLERAALERDGNLLMAAVDPDFDALQGEPRFAALLQRMGTRPLPRL